MVPLAPVPSFIPYSIHKRASEKGALKSYLVELVREVNEGKRIALILECGKQSLNGAKDEARRRNGNGETGAERPVGWSGDMELHAH